MLDWNSLDWQSVATFFTGILAVAGATLVGWRQAAISARQTAILDRQAELEELKLRADLFDRRFDDYLITERFLQSTIYDDAEDPKLKLEFSFMVDRARFLFGYETYERLLTIYKDANRLWELKKEQDHLKMIDEEIPDSPIDEAFSLKELLFESFANLSQVFGDDLMLVSRSENPKTKTIKKFGGL